MMRKNFIVKASLFTLILAFMVAGTIAIAAVMRTDNAKNVEIVKKKAPSTWYLNGTDPMNPAHYSLTQTIPCSGLAETICSIQADNNSGSPLLTQARKDDIQEVLDAIDNNETPVPNSTVNSFRSE